MESNDDFSGRVFRELRSISTEIGNVKKRLTSLESWVAALTKKSDFQGSASYQKNIQDLKERTSPVTIEIKEDFSCQMIRKITNET